MKFYILLAISILFSATLQAQDNDTVFEKIYSSPSHKPITIRDHLSVADIYDDYYLSIRSLNGGWNNLEVYINNKKITHFGNLLRLQKHLFKLDLKNENEIIIKLQGQKNSSIELKVLKLGSFKEVWSSDIISSSSKQTINKQFSIENTDYDHILVVEPQGKTVLQNLVQIKLNNKTIVSPLDFVLSKKKRVLKIVNPNLQNNISFQFLTKIPSSIKISILSPNIDSSNKIIGPNGGEVSLSNVGSATFTVDSFASDTTVKIATSESEETKNDFNATAIIFNPFSRLEYEIKINTGAIAPLKDIEVDLAVSDEFLANISNTNNIFVFTQIFQKTDSGILDNFELFGAEYNSQTKSVRTIVPSKAFTNQRTLDYTYEAIIIVGSINTETNVSNLSKLTTVTSQNEINPRHYDYIDSKVNLEEFYKSNDSLNMHSDVSLMKLQTQSLSSPATTACPNGANLGRPLYLENLVVERGFDPSIPHYGTDYVAREGREVYAMADGVVEHVGHDVRVLREPDPTTKKTIKGWGNYIVIRHNDGSATLYAHLKDGSIYYPPGTQVEKHRVIALSGNTGGSSGPHLHVEYVASGSILARGQGAKIDPHACIEPYIFKVTVLDDGTALDDSISIALDGAFLGTLPLGSYSTTFTVDNVISDSHVITVTCVLALDNGCTYALRLGQSAYFSLTTTKSITGILAPGSSVNIPLYINRNYP